MVKVTISLPNKAQITLESEDPEVVHEIVGMALRDLPGELMRVPTPVNGQRDGPLAGEKGTSVGDIGIPSAAPGAPAFPETGWRPGDGDGASVQQEHTNVPGETAQFSRGRSAESFTSGRQKAQHAARTAAAELAFIQFCQSASPLVDMRKVVVAAEGAARFLQMDSVDAQDLKLLFERVGWLPPHNFIQTLRNAARSKFRWLESVPGRTGRYTVTAQGRATTLNI